jgi:pimeloyl-ACP methyl ester carboxylesterase
MFENTIHPPRQIVTGYAPVNGLEMYYEIHGTGQPLVLLHGGMTTIGDFALLLPLLAKTRQIIAFERQGHGHTADIDRPFSLDQMAEDLAGLLRHLNIEGADVLGYSTGGAVALEFALRHPDRLGKLVLMSTIYNTEGYYPQIFEGLKQATAEAMPPIMQEMYTSVAPRPQDWSRLVAKSVEAAAQFTGWQLQEVQSVNVPTLIISGDSDIVRPEHAVEMYRLLPNAQLAILPGTDHIGVLFQRAEWASSMITAFLDHDTNKTG